MKFLSIIKSKSGFTLIELLVVVSIIALTVGASVAAYVDFNDRQELLAAGKLVESILEAARSKAATGETPTDCDFLEGYLVSAPQSTFQIDLEASCNNGTYVINTYNIPNQVNLTSGIQVTFKALHGGADTSTITLTRGGDTYQIEVDKGGSIRGGLLEVNP